MRLGLSRPPAPQAALRPAPVPSALGFRAHPRRFAVLHPSLSGPGPRLPAVRPPRGEARPRRARRRLFLAPFLLPGQAAASGGPGEDGNA
ncbi:hypothetical protein GCM10009605_44360 [Nocardiopsis composta]